MASETDFDLLVVGGGMVGASLACALRGMGLRVGLVEAVPLFAANQPSFDDRTIALAHGSQRIFETLGVWQAVDRAGATPIEHIHVSDRGRFGLTHLSAREAGMPALGQVVENRVLGAALFKTLEGASNVTVFCPASMRAIDFTPARARVTIENEGRETVLTAALVVAADGAFSSVRQAVGIEAKRQEYDQVAIVTNVALTLPHNNTAYERFTESGPLALLPMSNQRMAVVWSVRAKEAESLLALPDDAFLLKLQERFGERLGAFARVGKRAHYPLALTKVAEHARERLVLIGNAAHTVHPVAGQGFNLGLRDVAALAEVLSEALKAGEDIGSLTVLQRYRAWRQRDNQVISGFTHGLISTFSNDFPPFAFARNAALAAVDLLPGAKRALIRITSGLAGKLPKLARGLPL